MRPTSFMLIAGEASGDQLAAELVAALRRESQARAAGDRRSAGDEPPADGLKFFGAGGAAMRSAGVELVEDMTRRAVIGISEVAGQLREFIQLMNRLIRVAIDRQPEAIICIDYGGFNLRFQRRLRRILRSRSGPFNNWRPRLVQFVSPQVWGSRPGRAFQMEKNLDLLISILPFEKSWFAARTPKLRVEYVGHPLIGRHTNHDALPPPARSTTAGPPVVTLLPGSRRGEIHHHLPVLKEAVRLIHRDMDCRFQLVVPAEELAAAARSMMGEEPVEVIVGELGSVLRNATIALSKTGTITLELALFGVPAITFYKTTAATYWIARLFVQVKWLSMPNLLADAVVLPEFVQDAATAPALANAALALLRDAEQRRRVTSRLRELVATLGEPGAPDRAARAVLDLFRNNDSRK